MALKILLKVTRRAILKNLIIFRHKFNRWNYRPKNFSNRFSDRRRMRKKLASCHSRILKAIRALKCLLDKKQSKPFNLCLRVNRIQIVIWSKNSILNGSKAISSGWPVRDQRIVTWVKHMRSPKTSIFLKIKRIII